MGTTPSARSSRLRLFQCSSASRKFLNQVRSRPARPAHLVSVLFSEPKIPQSPPRAEMHEPRVGFSALQRAENSSINVRTTGNRRNVSFQCSSASRKFLNQRAGSPGVSVVLFQCSSASRKFLNRSRPDHRIWIHRRFQCSSASRKFLNFAGRGPAQLRKEGFQCSSASRKFLNKKEASNGADYVRVSVLFSEPKIPQS